MQLRITLLVAFTLWAGTIPAGASDAVDQIRNELEQLKSQYETRLRSLERRLEAAERHAEQTGRSPAQTAGVPVSSDRNQVSGNAFNPAISAVVQTKLSTYSGDPEDVGLAGFQVGGETGQPPEGFSLDETELTISANVDHVLYGEITVGLHEDEDETEIDVEEAFFDTLSLPGGLALRGGRFYSGIGYLNHFHTHTWDFHDAPLPYRAFLGGQYRDDGVRLSWLAPTDLYMNMGAELLQGNRFPGGGSNESLGDGRAAFVQIGGDFNASNSWRFGLSTLRMNGGDRSGGGHGHDDDAGGTGFSGDSDLWIADLVWKWAPSGNPRHRNLTLLGEFFFREEDGRVTFIEDGASARLDYDGEQSGFYAQAVYQFVPRWRIGLRYDWLDSDNNLNIIDAGGLDPDKVLDETSLMDADDNPQRWSLMTDFSPSEFSRLRLQYNRDDTRDGDIDHQWTLQYIMSLGAHGAHEF